MNTLLPRELRDIAHDLLDRDARPHIIVPWFLTFADGSSAHNLSSTWSDYAHSVSIDGLQVYLTHKEVSGLYIYPERDKGAKPLYVRPPQPMSFFALSRHSQALSGEHQSAWLYTIFGYALQESVFITRVLPTHTEVCLLPRPLHFDL